MFQREENIDRPIVTIDVEDMTKALATIHEHGDTPVGDPEQSARWA